MNADIGQIDAPIAVNINFDSLGEALGYPPGYQDPSFFKLADRFFEYSNRFGFKYSIFVIGKDLENPEVFSRVREWHDAGHEIGNHSWSHQMNLGGLPLDQVRTEVESSHEIITKCIGTEPRGFIAPAWSSGKHVISTLIDLDYDYDTSVFPSISLIPMIAKIAWNHRKNQKRLREVLGRKDWLYQLTRSNKPTLVDRNLKNNDVSTKDTILLLPLPTMNRIQLPFWHTLFYLFKTSRVDSWYKRLLNSHRYFYYLTHPADLIWEGDIESNNVHHLERMAHPLEKKILYFESAMQSLVDSGRPFFLMRDLASQARREISSH